MQFTHIYRLGLAVTTLRFTQYSQARFNTAVYIHVYSSRLAAIISRPMSFRSSPSPLTLTSITLKFTRMVDTGWTLQRWPSLSRSALKAAVNWCRPCRRKYTVSAMWFILSTTDFFWLQLWIISPRYIGVRRQLLKCEGKSSLQT